MQINSFAFTPSEWSILRKSAAQMRGTALPKSIGGKLRYALKEYQILRKKDGSISGFGQEGFVATPHGIGLYFWGEESQRQAHINW